MSDHPIGLERFQDFANEVTGMEASDTATSATDAVVSFRESDEVTVAFHKQDNELAITGPAHLFRDGRALTYSAEYTATCLRASRDGLLLVHAAALQLPDQNSSCVFFGEKGAGKTTMALRLCHQYDYKLIGNDQVYTGPGKNGNLVTNGGNPWFHVRQTAISADPYIAKLVSAPETDEKPAWNNKIRVNPADIGVEVAEGEIPVKALFHIRIDHSQPNLLARPWGGLQMSLVLHERFGRHITGQATPFHDDKGNYLGSLPPIGLERALEARDELVHMVLRAGVTEIFAPDSDSAIAYVQELGE